MEYVMVPVPEDIAEDVLNYLRWNVGKPAPVPFEEASIARVYEGADDLARALLLAVASAKLNDDELTVAQVADLVECSDREVVGLTVELSHLTQVEGGPPFLLMLKEASGPSNDDRPWSQRTVMMDDTVARLFRQAAEAGGGQPD